ncbi:hypothetical protein BH09MYX1_BH09MYX1_39730 [soil metagenome]
MIRSLFVATFALAVAAPLMLRATTAQEEDAADVAAARQIGIDGVRLADAGKCTDAVDKLARAERLFHAPTTLGRLGECEVALGRVVEGTEKLRHVVRESLAPGAPQAFVTAQDRARSVLEKASARIARLKIVVIGSGDADVAVRVDDQPISAAAIGVDRPSDPGDHVVEATAPGFLVAKQKITLKDGGSEVVTLNLVVDPNAPKNVPPLPEPIVGPRAPVPAGDPDHPKMVPADTTAHNFVPAFVALGFGGAGLVVGSVFGGLALSAKSSLVDACSGGRTCPPSAMSTYDRAATVSTVSTVGFVVGGVGVAAAIVLFIVAPTKKLQSASLVPLLGAGYFGFSGTF